MAGYVRSNRSASRTASNRGTEESPVVRWILITIALLFAIIFLLLPLLNVFAQAFSKGLGVYFAALTEPDAIAAIKLTLKVAAIVVPLNVLFGLAAGMGHRQVQFPGQIDAEYADRPAVFGFAGRRRVDVCNPFRPAGIFRTVAGGSQYRNYLCASRHCAGHRCS